jgi:hypothetical protein
MTGPGLVVLLDSGWRFPSIYRPWKVLIVLGI